MQAPPKQKGKGRLRKLAEIATIVGGFGAVVFPLFGIYLGWVQEAKLTEYQVAYTAKSASVENMKPMAGWVLASNQIWMFAYLFFYVLVLQRPKIKRTFKRVGLTIPIWLLLGVINGVVNIVLMQ